MRFPSKETVERIRKEYPVGTRVELVQMDDPPGTAHWHERRRARCGRYRQHHGCLG